MPSLTTPRSASPDGGGKANVTTDTEHTELTSSNDRIELLMNDAPVIGHIAGKENLRSMALWGT
jgi:hypothetical protein